jgi:hypothetical protein
MPLSSADHAKMLSSLYGWATFLAHGFLKEPGLRGADVRAAMMCALDVRQSSMPINLGGPWRGARRAKP